MECVKYNKRNTADPLSKTQGHPWFAATYNWLLSVPEQVLLGQIRRHVAGEATGQVLEIGVGTGANFRYYRSAVEPIVANEPDPYMLRQAKQEAVRLGRDVEFCRCPAEALAFADCSFDTIVITLVLCTVVDQAAAFAEMKRVLKPDGSVRFLEHVRSAGAWGAQVQDLLTPIWRQCGAGCHLNRRTAENMQAAGFEIVETQRKQLPLLPLIYGVARPQERTLRQNG